MNKFYLNSLLGLRVSTLSLVLAVLMNIHSSSLQAQCSSVSGMITVNANAGATEIDADGDGTPDFSFSYNVLLTFMNLSITGLNGHTIASMPVGGVPGASFILMDAPVCESDNFIAAPTLYNAAQGIGLVFAGSGGAYIGIQNGSQLGFMQIKLSSITASSVTIMYSNYGIGPGMNNAECGERGVVAGDCDSLLPVELSVFEAVSQDYGVKIRWVTESEFNNAGFHLERSLDGRHFEAIHWMDGYGNSLVPREYIFTDLKLPKSTQYYYRLQQVDKDGTTDYSEIVVVDSKHLSIIASAIYPNPANTVAHIDIEVNETMDGKIWLYDASGKVHATLDLALDKGRNIVELPVLLLDAELLFAKIHANNALIYRKLSLLRE